MGQWGDMMMNWEHDSHREALVVRTGGHYNCRDVEVHTL